MTSQSQELSNEQIVEFFKVESEKLAKTGLVPALILDAVGAFGNYGSIDSLLTPIAAVGGMAGYYGGRNHLVDGPVLAGVAYGVGKLGALVLDHLKDGKINETQPDALKYLAAYALAALAGKSVQYVKDNWKTKTKPAIYATGRAIDKFHRGVVAPFVEYITRKPRKLARGLVSKIAGSSPSSLTP